jgi:hypothetical protein
MTEQCIIDLVTYIAGCYEVIARAIPTKKDWSLVHKILKILVVVSEFMNNKKPKSLNPVVLLFVASTMFLFSCKTTQVNCKHSTMLPVTLQINDSTFTTTWVYFCDTILVTSKTK